jgi:AmmeMemoRadiSam system protein B
VLAVAVLVVVAFAAVLAPAAAAPDAVAGVEAEGPKAAEGGEAVAVAEGGTGALKVSVGKASAAEGESSAVEASGARGFSGGATAGGSPAVMVCPPLPEGIRRTLDAAGSVPPEDAGFSGGDGAAGGAEAAADRDNAALKVSVGKASAAEGETPAVETSGARGFSGGAAAGGIVPHHDLAGAMMLRFYDALAEAVPAPERIILIAPDHYRAGRSPVSTCGADWLTEFGLLSADQEGVAALTGAGLGERQDRLFRSEHSITNHLPLLRRTFPGATVLPLVVRKGLSDLHLLALRKALLPLVKRGGLILLSMDLSHGKTPAGAAAEDARTLPVLRELRTPALRGLDLDCPRGAALLFALLRDLGATQARLLDHTDSCLLLNDGRSPCTSYATLLYLRHSCGQRGAPSAR